MRPAYLTGERMYLRAMLQEDAERATAWFDSPFPINSIRAKEILTESHKAAWWEVNPLLLAIVLLADERILGGVELECDSPARRTGWLKIHLAPALTPSDADDLRADAVRLTIPWLRDEAEMMTVTVPIAADHATTLAAAEDLGMVPGVRLREYVARAGKRVDLLYYQALNPRWEVPGA